MNFKGKNIFFLLFCLMLFTVGLSGQTPPQPKMASSNDPVPCETVYDDDGNVVTPPPGLCIPVIPIDNHLTLLLIGGFVLGVYFILKGKEIVSR